MNIPMSENRCPECGAPLMPGAAQGLCARCLLAGAAAPTDHGAPPRRIPAPCALFPPEDPLESEDQRRHLPFPPQLAHQAQLRSLHRHRVPCRRHRSHPSPAPADDPLLRTSPSSHPGRPSANGFQTMKRQPRPTGSTSVPKREGQSKSPSKTVTSSSLMAIEARQRPSSPAV